MLISEYCWVSIILFGCFESLLKKYISFTASLPPQSLLPLLSSLLKVQPALKSTILPLIPRPTLETAIQALAQSAKRLREAYPYSNPPAFSQATSSFGSTTRPSEQPAFGHSAHGNQSGMRDDYIISRLRPHVSDFVSSCMSYLPYFTCVPSSTQLSSLIPSTSQSHLATTIQSLHKDKFHPSETFLFLSAVTKHLIEQPPLTLSQLSPLILGRLSEDWKMWVDKVDELVNRQGGMFGSETVRGWERGLDEMAAADALEVSNEMRAVRDSWVAKVGWLVGRTVVQHMDEI
jgi:proteasome tether protein Cut8